GNVTPLTQRTSGWDDFGVPNSTNVFHATTSANQTQSVLRGIDPKYLNPDSRFGPAFYVARNPETALAELTHHGASSTHGIRFALDESKMRVLDLTDSATARAWNYSGGPISSSTQAIGEQ